jgi:uncharacterized protein
MKEAIILHGAFGSPTENWFPWLKQELEELSYTVQVPTFSTPTNQNLQQWLIEFYEQIETTSKETIIIAHSLAPAFTTKLLENQKPYTIKACFFIAPFCSNLGIKKFDSINTTFINRDFNWPLIQKSTESIAVFGSTNDPYVSKQHVQEFANNCAVQPIWVENAGHFNSASGYATFPLLLHTILTIAS